VSVKWAVVNLLLSFKLNEGCQKDVRPERPKGKPNNNNAKPILFLRKVYITTIIWMQFEYKI
jgi:hypothetical protein